MAETLPDASRSGAERRRSPRFEALDKLLGILVPYDLPVRIRDVGFGGFSVETVEPLTTGARGPVRFMSPDNWTTELTAESLYCRPSIAADGTPRYVTGFQFINEQAADVRARISELIAKVTSVRLFEA